MTNRRDYHKGRKSDGRYVRLPEWMLASVAWRALDGNCRGLYVEIARRYRGPNSNNGKIPFSVREAAVALSIGRSTAQRCFDRLKQLGFLRVSKRSGFNNKGRVSTEWLLTEFPDDTITTSGPIVASKDFMKWAPENSFHGPTTETDSPATTPPVDLTWDRVA